MNNLRGNLFIFYQTKVFLCFEELPKICLCKECLKKARQCVLKNCNKRLIISLRCAFVFLLGLETDYASSYALCAKFMLSIIQISSNSVSEYQIKYSMTVSLEHFLKTIDRGRPPDGN